MSTQQRTHLFIWLRAISVLLMLGLLVPANPALARPNPGSGALRGEPSLAASGTNLIQDPGFEPDAPNPYWTQYGLPVLCTTTSCGGLQDSGWPRSGSGWAWIGGSYAPSSSGVYQSVTIPAGGLAMLSFYLWITSDAGYTTSDVFRVFIDSSPVWSVDATQIGSYSSYQQVSVDVSSFADGAAHTLKFQGDLTGHLVSFNVDDTSLFSWPTAVSISGNAGVGGVLLSVTGGLVVAADGIGNYSLKVPSGWSGTVTPSNRLYNFVPESRTYSGLAFDQIGENYTAFLSNVGVWVNGSEWINYYVASGDSMRRSYAGVNNGPVWVFSNAGILPVVASERVIYGGKSYSEMMGYPSGAGTDFYFPWYNNVAMDSQLRVSNLGSTTANIQVFLGSSTTPIDSFPLAVRAAYRQNYPGKNGGPLHVHSDTPGILATVRVLYGGKSYSEMMGYPDANTINFYFPWYNNVAMDSQLRISNLGYGDTQITVKLGSTQIDSFPLPAGAAFRKNYPGQNGGPLHVSSTPQPILSTIRVLYGGTSYSEMMGYPGAPSTDFYFPAYDNVSLDSQLRISNLGGTLTTITVTLGTDTIDNFSLAGGAAYRKNYPWRNGGPLHVHSDTTPILATVRTLYGGSSFYELFGYPNNTTTDFFFPWYNNVAMDTQVRVAVP